MLQNRSVLKHHENGHDVEEIPQDVQEVYSLRCIPQIVGPILDTYKNTKRVLETEMNSVSDNPVVDWENGKFLHGGNFHGDYVAVALDQLKASLVMFKRDISNEGIVSIVKKRLIKFIDPRK